MNGRRLRAVRQCFSVGRFLLASGSRDKLRFWLACVFVLLLLVNGLNVAQSYVGRDFISAVSHRDGPAYARLAFGYLGVFVVSSLSGAFLRFSEDRLRILWRELGTKRLLDRYFTARAYLRIARTEEVDNPDQRITDDTRTFTGMAESVIVLSANAALTSIAFLSVLWSITPWLMLAAFAYAAVGSVLALVVGRPLVPLNDLQLTKEANLRYQLIRVREAAESVAVSRAEEPLKRHLHGYLASTLDNFKNIVRATRNLATVTSLYGYLMQLVPVLIVAPLYMSGKVEFGVVTQAIMAFSQVMGALSLIVTQYEGMSPFFAVGDRIDALIRATSPSHETRTGVRIAKGAGVGFHGVRLHAKDDAHMFLDELTFEVAPRRSLLIAGRKPRREARALLGGRRTRRVR